MAQHKSLEEVHGTIDTTQSQTWWKRFFLFAGPAFLVAVGYMDPGNWATDIAGGSKYGYSLLWVLLMSNLIALLLQTLSARLGIHLQLEHPAFKAAVRRIADACNKHGKLARGSAETEAQIAEYYKLGCKVLNLPGTDLSTYHDGLKARAGRAHAQLKALGVTVP